MNQQPYNVSPRTLQERKYATARANLLLVVIITTLNVFLSVIQSGTYLLFAAQGPMIIADIGVLSFVESGDMTYLVIFGVIAFVSVIPYLLCWLFSKKHVGWMIGALVYFSLDCILLLLFFDVSLIVDILFHAWVMYYLILGVVSGMKLRSMPEEVPVPPAYETQDPFWSGNDFDTQDTTAESAQEDLPQNDSEDDTTSNT